MSAVNTDKQSELRSRPCLNRPKKEYEYLVQKVHSKWIVNELTLTPAKVIGIMNGK